MSTWIRIDDTMPDNPKIVAAGGAAAWLYTCSIAYSSRCLTDGFIPTGIAPRLTDFENTTELAARLVANGLWKTVDGGWQIHDYAEHQRTAAEVEEQRSEARERQARSRNSKTTRAPRATDNASPQVSTMSQVCHSDVTRDMRVTEGGVSRACHSDVTQPEPETEPETDQPPNPPVGNSTVTDHPSGGGGGTAQLTALDIASAAAHALAQATPGINNSTAWTRTVTARLTRDHPDITDLANRNGPNAAINELIRRETQPDTPPPSRPTTHDLQHAAKRWATNIHHQHATGPNGTSLNTLLDELHHTTRHMPADEQHTWHNTALTTYKQLAGIQ